jgi:predicted RNA-binding Zn ribbon-like protein
MVNSSTATNVSLRQLRLLAGRPALDFANTVDPRVGDSRIDYLRTYLDLLDWAARAGVVSSRTANQLKQTAGRNPTAAGRALVRARQLREAIYRIFSAISSDHEPTAADLRVIEDGYRDALRHARLERHARSFHWQFAEHLGLVRRAIARDAMLLLESNLLERVKLCPGSDDCGWLFLDASKNGSRRWCSMDGCGNRVKVRRHLARRSAKKERRAGGRYRLRSRRSE